MTGYMKIVLPLVGSAFLVAGLVTAFWMIGSASGERDKFSSLEIAPAEADVFFAINTDPTSPQWLALNRSLDSIGVKDPLREAIDEALAEVNLDWEEDIVPIAGDEAFVSVPDVSAASEGGGFVAGFRLRDENGAREVFEKLRAFAEEEDGEEFLEEEYEGVTIFYTEPPGAAEDVDPEEDIFFECYVAGEDDPSDECASIFECPWFTEDPDDDFNFEDEDDNGLPDDCEKGPFFADPEGETTVLGGQAGGAVAIFDNVLALGAVPDDVKGVIDVVQGRAPSAETNDRLQEFRAAQEDDFLMWGYVDMASVWDMVEEGGFPTGFGVEQGETDERTFPPEDPATYAPQPDDFTITQFESELTFGDIGFGDTGLFVTETIAVDFGTAEKHGIFRDVPEYLPYDDESEVWLWSSPVSIMQDGEPAVWGLLFPGPTQRIRIGDPDVLISGQHVYEVTYSVSGAVWPLEDGTYQLTWPVTGDGWNVPIENASGNLTLPDGAQILSIACSEGSAAASLECPVGADPAFPNTAHFQANQTLSPNAGMTIVATLAGDFSGIEEPFIAPTEYGFSDYDDDQDGDMIYEHELDFDPFADIDVEETMEQLRGQFDRMGFSISSFDEGFALDFTVLQAPDYEAAYEWQPSEAFDPHFARSVPEDTMFFLAMNTFYQQGYAQFREQLSGLSEEQREAYDDVIEMIADEVGINIEDDLLALLTGETAIAGNISGFDSPEFEVVGMADVADDAKAVRTLEKLGAYLEGQGVTETGESGGVNLWTPFGAMSSDAIGWSVKDGVAAIGYPWEVTKEAGATRESSLADTRDWQRTLDLLPDNGVFVGYLSIARILEELKSTPDAEASFEGSTGGEVTLDDLNAIRALGYSATIRENGFGFHLVLFMEDR